MSEAITPAWLRAHALPDPGAETDKNSRGRALVIAGADVPGAALLAGEAALRAGAGKLQMAAPPAHAVALAIAFPEARVVPQEADGALGEAARDCAAHCDAAIVGPGWIDEAAAARMARALIAAAPSAALVLDAAAMTGLRHDVAAVRRARQAVLTPHAGEMARLLDRSLAEIEAAPEVAAREAAGRFGAVVALKGATTHIAAPDGRLLRHEEGAPGLATSGSGDVLAGLLGGLLARGAEPVVATAWAVWLHGAAGRRLSQTVGPFGFLARELSPLAPSLMKEAAP